MRTFDEVFLVKWVLHIWSTVIIQVFGAVVYVPIGTVPTYYGNIYQVSPYSRTACIIQMMKSRPEWDHWCM